MRWRLPTWGADRLSVLTPCSEWHGCICMPVLPGPLAVEQPEWVHRGWERLGLSSPVFLPLQEEVRSDNETRAAATRVLAQLADGCSVETCEAELLPRILRRAEDSAFQVRQVSLLSATTGISCSISSGAWCKKASGCLHAAHLWHQQPQGHGW